LASVRYVEMRSGRTRLFRWLLFAIDATGVANGLVPDVEDIVQAMATELRMS